MSTRRLALTMLLASLALGCTDRRPHAETGVLVLSETEFTAAFVRNFNPLLEVGNVRWPARGSMYETLLIHNPIRGTYVPWLAESYAWSEDRRSLRFHLRSGVKWSDGRPFSERDVVFTFNLLKKYPALDLHGAWKFVSKVYAPEPASVEIELSRPYAPGFYDLVHQPIVPEHIWKDVQDPVAFTNPNPVATGPFTEILAFQGQAFKVGRNASYWQKGKPAVKALKFTAFMGNEQANLALIRGELDWAGVFVPAVDRIFVARDPEHHKYWFPLLDTMVFLYANTTKPPLSDARVRKALSMAIDRKLVVGVAMHGTTRPADATALSDAFTRFRSEKAAKLGTWTKLDRARARKGLDEAGLTVGSDGFRQYEGKTWKVQVICPAGFSDWVRAAQVIVNGLRKVGVDAGLKTYDFSTWYERVQKGEIELSLGWSSLGPTPYQLFRGVMSTRTVKPVGEMSSDNWHRFGSKAADALLAKLELTTDEAEQRRLFEQLQLLFVEHAPAIPLFPGPLWGECNTKRFTGFPSKEDPYAALTPYWAPQSMLVLTRLEPR